ncbi:Rpn family recombination-promoting nuclease/putative transposase [Turicibacter faecis]
MSFLNAVLLPDEPITSITFKDRVLDKQYKNDKLGSLDILATTNKGELINVEVQVADEKNMIERSLYYWSRLFSGQLQSGNPYQKLGRTICINLLDFNLLDTPEYHSCYVLKEKERNEILSDLLELHFIELDKIKDIKQASDIKTQLEAWLEFIKHPESQVSYELARQDETIREAKDDLLILSCNEQFRLYYEARLKALLDETSRLQTARDEGIEQGKLEVAKKLLSTGMDIECVSEVTGISINNVKNLVHTS